MKKLKNLFYKHPNSIGETYFQHFRYASKSSLTMAKISGIMMLHAVFPFIYETTASEMIKEFNNEMQKRKKKDCENE